MNHSTTFANFFQDQTFTFLEKFSFCFVIFIFSFIIIRLLREYSQFLLL